MSGPFDSDEPIPGFTDMAERLAARYKAGGLREFENGSGWFTCRDCGSAVRSGYLLGHDTMHDLLDVISRGEDRADEQPPMRVQRFDVRLAGVGFEWYADDNGRWVSAEACEMALRAVEQRVRAIYEVPTGVWEEQSFDAGVRAARDAVAALQPYKPWGSEDRWDYLIRSDAIAAIDALPAQQNQNQNHDQQDRVNNQQQRVIHDPESQVTGERTTP